MNRQQTKTTPLMLAMIGLIVISIAVDTLIISPKTGDLKRLVAERSELHGRLDMLATDQNKETDAAQALGIENLQVLLSEPKFEAVSYLGQTLAASGLTRLDLTTVKSEASQNLIRTEFSVRAAGKYDELVEFTRLLESGVRLASIDDFTLLPSLTGKGLEGRFILSIYDTNTKR